MVLPRESVQRAGVNTAWYRGAEGTVDTTQTGETAVRHPYTGHQLAQLLQAVASPNAQQPINGRRSGGTKEYLHMVPQQPAATPTPTREERRGAV